MPPPVAPTTTSALSAVQEELGLSASVLKGKGPKWVEADSKKPVDPTGAAPMDTDSSGACPIPV